VAKGQPGDTETQTMHVLDTIKRELGEQHLTLGRRGDDARLPGGRSAQRGKMDFAGFMKGYTNILVQRINRISRAERMQVAALALPGLWWKLK